MKHIATILFFLFTSALWAQLPPVTVIEGGTLIDGTGALPLPDAVVVIQNGSIASIAKKGAASYPANAKVINAQGKFIIPALADPHVHYEDWMPELYLSYGVTTVLTPAGGEEPWLQAQREGIEKGKIPGPRLFLFGTGGGMNPPEFPIGYGAPIETETQVRDRIAMVTKTHIEGVKIHVAIGDEVLRAFVNEANKHGLPVQGHLGKVNAKQAALAGIHGISHLSGVAMAMMTPDDVKKAEQWRPIYARFKVPDARYFRGPDPRHVMLFSLRRPNLEDELIKVLVERHVYMDCDLVHVIRGITERRDEYVAQDYRLLSNANLDYIPVEVRQKQQMDFSMFEQLTPEERKRMAEGYRNIQEFIRKFVNAGGKIIAGTDAGSVASLPGIGVHRNLQLLVDAGLTPAQSLTAATKNFSEYVGLGWQNKLGTLEKGKLADLIILDANPLDNIDNTEKISLVMKDGLVVDRTYHTGFMNPLPNPERFVRDARANPLPKLRTIEPELVTEGNPSLQMVLKGADFVDSSIAKFRGAALESTFVNSSEMRVTIPAELLSQAGVYPVSVYTPQGGGESSAAYLIVKFK